MSLRDPTNQGGGPEGKPTTYQMVGIRDYTLILENLGVPTCYSFL